MAPKKAPKKAAKKSAPKDRHHEHHKDLRRAYEHLGRLEALRPSLPKTVLTQIVTLTEFSRGSLAQGDAESAAELLRACEHIAFAALAPSAKDDASGELRDALGQHYEKLREKALDRWEEREQADADEIKDAYEWSFDAAESAHAKSALRKALEHMRAAEALTHVRSVITLRLSQGATVKRLK